MARGRILEDKKNEVVKMAVAGMQTAAIAAELDLAVSTVYRILKSAGVVPVKLYATTSFKNLTDDQLVDFAARYNDLEPVLSLLDDFHLTYTQMYQLLHHLGIKPRTKQRTVIDARKLALDHALDLYQNTNLTITEIFGETGVHQPTLHREIRLRGISLRKPRRSRSFSSSDSPD